MDDKPFSLDRPADWAVVAQVMGLTEGEILVGRLRTAGIPATVTYESAGRAIGLAMGPLGRIEVIVPTERYEEAMDLLFGEGEDVDADAWLEDGDSEPPEEADDGGDA
ncbi:MAG: hypothetical protein M5R40_04790 [Anaerolineae bacterium]|nr:hypothetical protein [Anaerolineae bacterium]